MARTGFQSPKYGKSPLRIAVRALAISNWSIDAIKRANRPWDGANPSEAVLDISRPFQDATPRRISHPRQSTYTIYQQQRIWLHGSISAIAVQQSTGTAGQRKRP